MIMMVNNDNNNHYHDGQWSLIINHDNDHDDCWYVGVGDLSTGVD